MAEHDGADAGDTEPAEDEPIEEVVSETDGTEPTEDATRETDDGLVERVEETPNEELAREIDAHRERAETAERRAEERRAETEELESQLKRTQADFQNYKKRTERRQEELKERATEDLVERLLDVRDNLTRALSQDTDADIRPGVESTLEEFDRVLTDENVTTIEPEPGSDVDPVRHEVMMRTESDHPEDTVAEVYRPGYEMGEKVLRPAQITVSE